MAEYLAIDLEALRNTIKLYSDAIVNLEMAIEKVDGAMNQLQSTKWQSDASDAYFAAYSDRWKKSVREHLVALLELRDSLDKADREYSALDRDMGRLRDCLNF